MTWLGHHNLTALRDFLNESYRMRDLAAFAANVAVTLPRVISSELASYITFNRQIPRVTWITAPIGVVSPGADRILERLVSVLPVTSHRLRTGDVSALKITDLIDRTELHRLPVYTELFRPLRLEYEMGIALSVGSASSVAVALYRTTRDFSERDRLMLNAVRPHLREAHEAARGLTRLARETDNRASARTTAREGVAIDRRGTVRRMSRRAHAWLSQSFGVRLSRSRLPETLRLWIRQQEDALSSVTQELPLPRRPLVLEGTDARIIIRLLSGPDESYLVLERVEAAIRPASIEDRFALTGREAEVLAWVAQGKSNEEIAEIVRASPRTIHKHLERVYKKLGVDNRFAATLAVAEQAEVI